MQCSAVSRLQMVCVGLSVIIAVGEKISDNLLVRFHDLSEMSTKGINN